MVTNIQENINIYHQKATHSGIFRGMRSVRVWYFYFAYLSYLIIAFDYSAGQIDLPAMIDYTLAISKQSGLHYIGHSQGTTSFFVMGSLRTDMNEKIKSMHALGM